MNKTLFAVSAALIFSTSAFAGAPTVNLTNVGSINNTISTSAQTNLGQAGSSYSSATGIASTMSNGQASFNQVAPGAGGVGASINLSGQTATANSGNAFNVSTGNGVGSASTNGSAAAGLDVAGSYNNAGANIGNGYQTEQTLTLNGSIGTSLDGGKGTGSQGTSIGVNATTNGGGAVTANTADAFNVNGSIGADTTNDGTTTGVNVVGQINDTKTSVSNVDVTNTLSVGMGAGVTPFQTNTNNVSGNASANNSVNVDGAFNDPAVASIAQ